MIGHNKALRIIVFALLLFSISINNSVGQIQTNNRITKEYEKFNKTFKREVTNFPDSGISNAGLPYHISPDALPFWFYQFLSSNADTTFAIGISDPGLHPDKKLVQAINRAKGMAALLRNVKIRYSRNIYNADYLANNKGEFISKFEELYQLMPDKHTQKYAWDAVALDSTKFGETIVLIKVFSVNTEIESFFRANPYNIYCFNVEYQKSGKFELNSKVEIFNDSLFSKFNKNELTYTWSEVGKTANIRSWTDNKETIINAGYFKYKSSIDTLSSDADQSPGGNLMYGLWFGYINTLLKSIQNSIQPENLLVENVEEHYSKKFQDFSREISVIHASFKFDKIIINNNQIFVNLIINQ